MGRKEQQPSVIEQLLNVPQRAMSIDTFCARYAIGRTRAFVEIKQGRLRAKKIGRRTVISEDDAELWLRQLPALETKPAS
jgi:hypothetical protein